MITKDYDTWQNLISGIIALNESRDLLIQNSSIYPGALVEQSYLGVFFTLENWGWCCNNQNDDHPQSEQDCIKHALNYNEKIKELFNEKKTT